jgi:uncharacterized protein YndB with AHSA1/START domain
MSAKTEPDDGVIQKRVLIRASPKTVYRALIDPDELSEWFCDRAHAEPRVGGELRASWRCGKEVRRGSAVFRRLDPPQFVELEWTDEGWGELSCDRHHKLTYTIRNRKDGCELLMRDDGAPLPDTEAMSALEEGWISVLRDLKEHCETRERSSRPRPAFVPLA